MVDIGRQYGTSGSDFFAHELRSDIGINAQLLAVHVLADGYIFHFGRNDALLGVIHLRTAFSGFGTIGQGDMFETQMIERGIIAAHLAIF